MNITIINDCTDDNARGRQVTRIQSLVEVPVSYVGVEGDLQASVNIIDTLDAYEDREGIILVNVAPRGGEGKKWPNGTPFGYFKYKNVHVVSTVDGFTLSLPKKFGLTESVTLLDLGSVSDQLVGEEIISSEKKDYIVRTQFRSFDFLPYVAKLLSVGKAPVGESFPVSDIYDAPSAIWFVDNFGNCKTTLLKDELNAESVKEKFRSFKCYERLKDVPDGEKAFISGSSGLGNKRFIEIVVQGRRAADELTISPGDAII